jgi:hypothetical protein
MCLINDEQEPPNEIIFACSQNVMLAKQITTTVQISKKDFTNIWL